MEQSGDKRVLGVDLLRILSMFFVVVLHTLGVGGALAALPPGSLRYWTLWALEALSYCAVNCMGLISGYVAAGRPHPLCRLRSLWLQVFFYSAVITLVFALLQPGSLRPRDMLAPFIPVLNGTYWYFTAYFVLFLLMPFLDLILNALTRSTAKRLSITLVAAFSIMAALSPEKSFAVQSGYSVLWLVVLYLLGGCLRRFPPLRQRSARLYLLGYLACSLLALLGKELFEGVPPLIIFSFSGLFLTYSSPLILFSAIFLLLALRQYQPGHALCRRVIRFCAPLSFGVYLLHAHPLVWSHVLSGSTAALAQYSTPQCAALVLLIALFIFAAGICADFLRDRLFCSAALLFRRTSKRNGKAPPEP